MKGRPGRAGLLLQQRRGAVKRNGAIPAPVLPKGTFAGRNIPFTAWNGLQRQPARVAAERRRARAISTRCVDDDGVVRRVPMLAEYDGAYYEPLSLAMVRTLLGSPRPRPGDRSRTSLDLPGGLRRLGMARGRPAAGSRSTRQPARSMPYRGRKGSFTYFSLVDVLNDRVEPCDAEGQDRARRHDRAGAARPALDAGRAASIPGVEVHANLIAGMLDAEHQAEARLHAGRRSRCCCWSAAWRCRCCFRCSHRCGRPLATLAGAGAGHRARFRGLDAGQHGAAARGARS